MTIEEYKRYIEGTRAHAKAPRRAKGKVAQIVQPANNGITDALEFTLPYPPSVNHYWRHDRGQTHISAAGFAYRGKVLAVLRGTKMVIGRIACTIDIYPPDRRRRDVDNICKCLLDAMNHAGCYPDDSDIKDLRLVMHDDAPIRVGGLVKITLSRISGQLIDGEFNFGGAES